MAEVTAAVAPAADAAEESVGKVAIYESIAEYVKAKTGKNIGKTGGRAIFDQVTRGIFGIAVKEGAFRFNGGFGSFHMRTYKAGKRKLPSGKETEFGEREKLRYEEGVSVANLRSGDGASVAVAATPAAGAGVDLS